MNKSIKILLKWIVGPLLACWLFYSLYQQVKAQPDIDTSIALIREMPFGVMAWKFWLVIGFVFVNWGLEARKWQLLMRPLHALRRLGCISCVPLIRSMSGCSDNGRWLVTASFGRKNVTGVYTDAGHVFIY